MTKRKSSQSSKDKTPSVDRFRALASILCSPEDGSISAETLADKLATLAESGERGVGDHSKRERKSLQSGRRLRYSSSDDQAERGERVSRATKRIKADPRKRSNSSSSSSSSRSGSSDIEWSKGSLPDRGDSTSKRPSSPMISELNGQTNALATTERSESEKETVNKVLKTSTTKLKDKEIIQVLKTAQRGKLSELIMTGPPIKPKGGEIFLCLDKNDGKFDYRRDCYFGLKGNGDNSRCKKETILHRWYVHYQVGKDVIPGFSKEEYCLKKHLDDKPRIILVHYLGSESVWQPRPHGNSKSGKIFTPNTSSAREDIQKTLQDTGLTAQPVYEKVTAKASKRDDFPEREPVDVARDIKQVENEKQKLDAKKRVLRDDLFSVYEMIRSQRFEGFLKMFMVPDETFILAEPQTLKLASALLKEASKDPTLPQVIGYDTTFKIFDGYVSPLVMRNTFLEKNPIIPIAYLLHENRTGRSHDVFWREMYEEIFEDPLPDTVPICLDREKGPVKSIRQRLGHNVNLVYCNNHIKRDAKFWVHKNPGSHVDDEVILPKEIDSILCSETEERFHEKYDYFWSTWSVPFREYVDKNLKEDMFNHAAHFYTKKFPAFKDYDATNNISESCNRMIKRRCKLNPSRIDTAVYTLFNLQLSKLHEFHRAYSGCGLGSFVLKSQYSKSKPPFSLPNYVHMSEEEFAEIVKDGMYKPNQVVEKEGNFLQGRSAVAKLACKLSYVSLNSQTLCYVVTDPYAGDRNTVEERDGKLKCSCFNTGICFHKLAYLHVTQKEIIEDRCTWSLSKLRARTRKFKGRSGKKGPIPLEEEDFADVDAAPDSQVETERRKLRTIVSSEDEEVAVAAPPNSRANYTIMNRMDPPVSGASRIRDLERNEDEGDTCHSSDDDTDSSATVALSVSSDGSTPPEFRLTDTIPAVKSSLYNTPTYKCLKPNEQLMTDIVDDMVSLMILVHGMDDKISFADFPVWEAANVSCEDPEKTQTLLTAILRREPVNSSVLLVNIRVDSPPHFLLAAILFDSKEIVLINSLPNCPADIQPVLYALMRIAASSYIVAGLKFNQNEWKIFQESHSAVQVGGSDCGLFVIVNAMEIIRKRPFFTSENVPTSQHLRAWVLSCLTHKTVTLPVELPKCKNRTRLPRSGRELMVQQVNELPQLEYDVDFRSCAKAISEAIRGSSLVDGKCASKSCRGNIVDGKCVMCAWCRNWFHLGDCCPSTVVQESFYVCLECELKNGEQNE